MFEGSLQTKFKLTDLGNLYTMTFIYSHALYGVTSFAPLVSFERPKACILKRVLKFDTPVRRIP